VIIPRLILIPCGKRNIPAVFFEIRKKASVWGWISKPIRMGV
jgi:hypothetical protein